MRGMCKCLVIMLYDKIQYVNGYVFIYWSMEPTSVFSVILGVAIYQEYHRVTANVAAFCQ